MSDIHLAPAADEIKMSGILHANIGVRPCVMEDGVTTDGKWETALFISGFASQEEAIQMGQLMQAIYQKEIAKPMTEETAQQDNAQPVADNHAA